MCGHVAGMRGKGTQTLFW